MRTKLFSWRSAATVALLSVTTGACGGASYVIAPAEAAGMDDAEWVIKHQPKPREPATPAATAQEAVPDATTAVPTTAAAKP